MVTPTGTVALRLLQALGVRDRKMAQLALVIWCRPVPRLSVLDASAIMAHFPADPQPYTDDESLRGAEPSSHLKNAEYDGWSLGDPGRGDPS